MSIYTNTSICTNTSTCVEYIWVDPDGNYRTKCRIIYNKDIELSEDDEISLNRYT